MPLVSHPVIALSLPQLTGLTPIRLGELVSLHLSTEPPLSILVIAFISPLQAVPVSDLNKIKFELHVGFPVVVLMFMMPVSPPEIGGQMASTSG